MLRLLAGVSQLSPDSRSMCLQHLGLGRSSGGVWTALLVLCIAQGATGQAAEDEPEEPDEEGPNEPDRSGDVAAAIAGFVLLLITILLCALHRFSHRRHLKLREGTMRYEDDDSECIPHVAHPAKTSVHRRFNIRTPRSSKETIPTPEDSLGREIQAAEITQQAKKNDDQRRMMNADSCRLSMPARVMLKSHLEREPASPTGRVALTKELRSYSSLVPTKELTSAAITIQGHFRASYWARTGNELTTGKQEVSWDLFLSHVWGGASGGRAKMRVIKMKLKEMMPTLRVFLDVDDLKEGRGLRDVDRSYMVLIFATEGYFKSPNCMRELLRAVLRRKKIVVMGTQGADGVTIVNLEAKLGEALLRLKGWGIDAEVEHWGHSVPSAPMLKQELMRRPPTEFDALAMFQTVLLRTGVAAHMRVKGHSPTCVRDELTLRTIQTHHGKPALHTPREPCRYHLYCSPHNVGAAQLCVEVRQLLEKASKANAPQNQQTSDSCLKVAGGEGSDGILHAPGEKPPGHTHAHTHTEKQ